MACRSFFFGNDVFRQGSNPKSRADHTGHLVQAGAGAN
jgi:hypothetical protein